MSLQRCHKISDAEKALQQPYCSQLWKADCHFFTIFYLSSLLLSSILTNYSYQKSLSSGY